MYLLSSLLPLQSSREVKNACFDESSERRAFGMACTRCWHQARISSTPLCCVWSAVYSTLFHLLECMYLSRKHNPQTALSLSSISTQYHYYAIRLSTAATTIHSQLITANLTFNLRGHHFNRDRQLKSNTVGRSARACRHTRQPRCVRYCNHPPPQRLRPFLDASAPCCRQC